VNVAKLENSKRLQAILALLRDRGATGATTREISEASGALNPATEVSALRHNGVAVRCEFERKTETGSRVYRYWLVA
jgi:hypothetical protein